MPISIEEFRKREHILQKTNIPGEIYSRRKAKRFRKGPLGDIAMLSVQEISRVLSSEGVEVYMHLDPSSGMPMDFATMRYSTAFCIETPLPGVASTYSDFIMFRQAQAVKNKTAI